MKAKQIFEAVVTVQAARLRARDLHSSKATMRDNPLVEVHVMVPKGEKDVTVPTDCETSVCRKTLEPIWNESFAIPVLPGNDVLVFRVHMAASSVSHVEDGDEVERRLVGVCLLPVAHFDSRGGVTQHALELFSTPNEPGVGFLFVAAKVRRATISLLEIADLHNATLRKRYYSAKLSSTGRFLGIGELAAFLYEEGYSDKVDENWARALDLLTEQLAFRIYSTTDSMDDQANFKRAKEQIIADGGLWDGV